MTASVALWHLIDDAVMGGCSASQIDLPLAAFLPRFRGRDAPVALVLDGARVCQISLMIAARQAGPFALALRRIATCN